MPSTLPNPRLYLSHSASLDWLMAYEFGRVDDAQPRDCWQGVSDEFGYLLDAPDGRVVGFKVQEFSEFDLDNSDVAEIWEAPLFDAPQLGLTNASAGEVAVAARAFFGGESSFNRQAFSVGTSEKGEEALETWRICLQAGDTMAHFALGYTHFELGNFQDAYRHLRYYTEIAPAGPWNWTWFGRAAEAVGQSAEAADAYRRAIALTEEGEDTTDARERLDALTNGEPRRRGHAVKRLDLLGVELTQLDRRRVETLSTHVAGGLTRGRLPKDYAHTDPNEDALVVVESDYGTLIVCADGHNGHTSSHAAVNEVLHRLGTTPAVADLSDDELVELWACVGDRIRTESAAAGQPESRTTLAIALLSGDTLRWATMGDSLIAMVTEDGVTRLGEPRPHFVGWPMNRDEIDERLQRGTRFLRPQDWVVVASDGYSDFVPSVEGGLREAAASAGTASQFVDMLIEQACSAGAGDNVAVGAAQCVGVAEPLEDDDKLDRIRGCLFGGAVGDALGYPVEFMSLAEIREKYGKRGVEDYSEMNGHYGLISDDTQMTLFTAEGLMRAAARERERGMCDTVAVVDHAYARWLRTQGEVPGRWTNTDMGPEVDGWLARVPQLQARRAPGTTCLAAMRAPNAGSVERPLNDRKGCGGVMRVSPVGLVGVPATALDRFKLAADLAALTHGHPTGYLAAGALAVIIDAIVNGNSSISRAVEMACVRLAEERGHEETLRALEAALELAMNGGRPTAELVETLGEGWVAEEALAIGVYCALVAEDFEHGVLLAVNHSGDSDSTGQIAGAILGAALGADEIHGCWRSNLEIYDELNQVAADWHALMVKVNPWPKSADERYPAW